MRESVFINKEIPCPVCQLVSPLRYPDPRHYVAAARESDLHVTAYRWNTEECEGIMPHYYAVWQCPVCMFADLTERLEKPTGGPKEEALKESYIAIPEDKRYVLQQLRKLVPGGELCLNAAASLHISALLITGLPEEKHTDFEKLGRIALRLGWLYRERAGMAAEPQPVNGALSKLHDEVARLESQVLSLGEVLSDAQRAAVARLEELNISPEGKENPYAPITAGFNEHLGEMKTLLAIMQRTLLSDQRGQLTGGFSGGPVEPTDLDEVLISLKEHWTELPLDEEQSLRSAAEAYEYCYSRESSEQSIEKSIELLSLLVELQSRIGDYEKATSWISEIYNSGLLYKRELRSRITLGKSSGRLRAHEEQSLERKISNIEFAIAQAGESRRRLLDAMLEKYDPVIERVMKSTKGKPTKERESKLAEAGVPEEVISQLKIRKILKEKKKGLFGR